MASGRIVWGFSNSNPSQVLVKLRQLISLGVGMRQLLNEVQLEITKYTGDASLATDLGLTGASPATDQTTITNLVAQANGELNATASVQINIGSTTGIRQLLDALG